MADSLTLPVRGVVDSKGRLASADPPLARLQEEAGGALGAPLAVPQLAALARLARALKVALSRPALAGTADLELDLWVRVEPRSDDDVNLIIERWTEHPAPRLRWRSEPGTAVTAQAGDRGFEVDAALRLTRLGADLARQLGIPADGGAGVPLTRVLELQPDACGDLPLLAAVAARRGFTGQAAMVKRDGSALGLSAELLESPSGEFAGYRGEAVPVAGRGAPRITDDAEWNSLLRQPIDVIMTEAQRISDKAEGPLRSDYAAYAGDIASAARHLLDVLGSMNRQAETGEDGSEPIDLAALAAEAAGLVQPQAAEAGITLELEGATSLPAVGQPSAVTQILVNLIGNAVRYSPRGGSVRIEAATRTLASVSIVDQGPGVAAKDRERIFEPFEQASSKQEGAGLGLAISRRLARSMGGDISLDSAPGKGARFTLSLPPR